MGSDELTDPALVDRCIRKHGFEPWLNQTNLFKICTSHFLARCSTLLGYKVMVLAT